MSPTTPGANSLAGNSPGAPSEPNRRGVRRAIEQSSRFLAAVASLCTLLLVVAITADAISRNLTGDAIPGVVEFGEIFLVIIVYFSLAYTEQQDGHVKLQIATRWMSPRLRLALVLAGRAAVTLLLAWIVIETAQSAIDSLQRDEYRFGLLRVRMWPARAAISIGFLMLVLENALSFCDDLGARRSLDQRSKRR